MKCPNCSFENSDAVNKCNICGFTLSPREKTTPNRVSDASEEEALHHALKSLFEGSDTLDEEDPLDAAMMSRLLHKKRPQVEPLSPGPALETSDIKKNVKTKAPKTPKTRDDSMSNLKFKMPRNKIILILALAVIVILIVLLKISSTNSPWKYIANNKNTENTSEPIIETTEPVVTTEVIFTLGDDASLNSINEFYRALPDFINRGNLSILSLFESSQEALDVLTNFAFIGNLEKIVSASIDDSEINSEDATYTITTIMNRLINGQQTQTSVVWDFRVSAIDATWKIDSLAFETDAINDSTPIEPTTEPATQPATEPKTQPTTQPATQATTEKTTEPKVVLEGFIDSGSFSGGVRTTGQDIAFARYGNHDAFERLVFDIYQWQEGEPTAPVDVITEYNATITSDNRTIRIVVSGALDAYASNFPLDFSISKYIASISYNYFGSTETIAINITLKVPCQYKVFNLKSPGKLVIDVAQLD